MPWNEKAGRKLQALELKPSNFPWKDFSWERSIVSFGRVLGAVHMHKPDVAKASLAELQKNQSELLKNKKAYEANQVQIQIKASEAWIQFYDGE
jgi:hypothetical protein